MVHRPHSATKTSSCKTNRKPPSLSTPSRGREVSHLSPFDEAPPFLPDDYDDWALGFKLYCTPDMQNLLLTFDHPEHGLLSHIVDEMFSIK
jgi:hypothetical protein